MSAQAQLMRFLRMEQEGAQLRDRFAALTSAHSYLQGKGLKSISVSDALDDGSIEAVFMDVRIRFQLLMVFNDVLEPRGQVVCTHCHRAYGSPVQEKLGSFTFDTEGSTDLETCIDGHAVMLHGGAPKIVLLFLERAMTSSRGL